jgi:hypothetical protein
MLSMVPVYETSRRRHLMIREVRAHEDDEVPTPMAAPTPIRRRRRGEATAS